MGRLVPNFKKYNVFSVILYIFVFFPYLTLVSFGTDTQPFALIFSAVIIFMYITFRNEAVPKKLLPLFIAALISIVIGAFNYFSFNALRSVAGYISIFVITFGTFIVIKKDEGLSVSLIKFAIIIWGIVGLIQLFLFPDFLSQFLGGGMRTSEARGVTSLAPEPTYYGQMMYFFLFLVLILFKNKKERNIYIIFCLIQIILIAKSSMIVFILGLVIIVLFIEILVNKWSFKTFKYIFGVSCLALIFIFIFNYLPNETRLVSSINKILESPLDFFKNDASANDRLSAIYFSIKGSIESFLLPNGFEKWSEYSRDAKAMSEFFWYGQSQRIMSMYGAIIYEIGVFGLLIIVTLNKWLWEFIKVKNLRKYKLTYFAFLNLILFTAVPLTTPLIGFILGAFLYYGYFQKDKSKDDEFSDV